MAKPFTEQMNSSVFRKRTSKVTAQVKARMDCPNRLKRSISLGATVRSSSTCTRTGIWEVPSSASFMLPTPKLIGNCPTMRFGFVYQGFAAGVLSAQGENRYRIVAHFPKNFPKTKAKRCMPKSNSAFRQKQNLNSTFMMVFNLQSSFPPRQSILSGDAFSCRDAAHVHTPVGAQGMNTGIQDGYNLAWKLALVLNGKADTMILETYNQERLENAKHLLQTTDRMFDIAAGSDWLLVPSHDSYAVHFSLSDSAPSVKQFLFPLISQIGIHYRGSP